MNIAFDLRWIRSDQIDGISRCAINLISHLLQAQQFSWQRTAEETYKVYQEVYQL